MRTSKSYHHNLEPEKKYKSARVARLINYVMRDGKKTVAEKQVYLALEELAKYTKKSAPDSFDLVLESISPHMEVRSRRVGGAAYQVPMPVRPRRAVALALRWLVTEANKRSSKEYHTFAEKLFAEMADALNNQGGSIQKKETAHRMAEANKAFAHFRW